MTNATDTGVDLKPYARKLIGGFSMLPTEWVSTVGAKLDNDEYTAMPDHGWCFVVNDSCDRRAIEALLVPFVPEEQDELLAFIEDEQIDVDPSDYLIEHHALEHLGDAANAEPEIKPDYDLDALDSAVRDEWENSCAEDYTLDLYGWQKVGATGLIAREFDGLLVLGINGGGYDFYEAHWIPLYKAIGYGWHKWEA